jgi:hypothetical protein
MNDERPIVFISCGQSTAAECALGKQIAKLVEDATGCCAYFAENQRSLDGVTDHILKKLRSSVAFVAVMHPRGNVSNPHTGEKWVRGSVWVEQEIAIAAFMSQALEMPIEVIAYIHNGIPREGLRDKVLLNPTFFDDDSEVVAHLEEFLPKWKDTLLGKPRTGLSLKANMVCREIPVPGGSTSGDERSFLLDVGIENDGTADAKEFRLDLEFPAEFDDTGGHKLRGTSSRPGYRLFGVDNNHQGYHHVYPTDKVDVLSGVRLVVRNSLLRSNRELSERPFIATVYSSDMKPRVTQRTIMELIAK